MRVLWTQIKLLTSHFSGKDYYPCFYCLKKAIRKTEICLVLFPRLSWYLLRSRSLVLYMLGDYGHTWAPKNGMLCQNWNQRHQHSCLLCDTTELWTACRAPCSPSATAEILSVCLWMHAMSQLPSNIHNMFVSRAGGLSPRFLPRFSMLGFHLPHLLPATG